MNTRPKAAKPFMQKPTEDNHQQKSIKFYQNNRTEEQEEE